MSALQAVCAASSLAAPRSDRGSVEALTALIERQRPSLLRIAWRRCGNREDAEDALQEAFLSAYRHLDQFDGRAQLSSWLTRIVINAATDQVRRQLARPSVALAEQAEEGAVCSPLLPDPAPNPEQRYVQTERRHLIERLSQRLPKPWRDTVHLRVLEGYSTRETAQKLGVAEGTIKTHLFRAHRQLKRSLPVRQPVSRRWRVQPAATA